MDCNGGWATYAGWDGLLTRARSLVRDDRRGVLGITGTPGAGKSTLASALCEALNVAGVVTALLPMDGFHLGDDSLRRHGLLDRKGAIDTFDGWGYLATVRRIRHEGDHSLFVPGFQRDLEQPIAAALEIPSGVDLVITEGNYLLDDQAPWNLVRAELDEAWYLRLPDAVRIERLVSRHVLFGKEPEEARAWVRDVDEANALHIQQSCSRADLVIDGR